MRTHTIRLIIALATLCIGGIMITQTYWVKRAFDIKEQQFNQNVHSALKNVAERITELNEGSLNDPAPVKRLDSDYYVTNVNDVIDATILEHYLEEEFSNHNLLMDYEYGVYDCSSNEMVYGGYVARKGGKANLTTQTDLPQYDEFIYYFGVRFPTKTAYLAGQMDIWAFTSFILVSVLVFFAYTLFVILKQKRLSEVQRDFINNMTHEFKTPISTIAVSADLITNPQIADQSSKVQQYAEIIKTQNNRLKGQIEKVLQMAIMDRGKLTLSKELVSIHKILHQAVEHFQLKFPEADIQCDLSAKEDCAEVDKVHFTNIIYNLLDNASKYVEGHPRIRIQTRSTRQYTTLSIQDNGIGIDKAHQSKVFDRFYRVPTGNRHDVKGFGLGLNYVKQIIKAHHWKIRLNSSLGKGSTFYIQIPRAKTKKKTEANSAKAVESILVS